ncbi:MAG: histidinol-phosphatase, partial [Phaeodactylibacter sp.]|nr:histidinol-phosphatase [Phaeodactylibacter sp.]
MKKILFLDRDGTLILEPKDYIVDTYEKVIFYPGIFYYLSKIVQELDFELVMITNQDGLGTPALPEEKFRPVHDFVVRTFAGEGIHFREILIDHTFPADKAPTRKPGTGLLTQYMQGDFDLANSFVVGDRLTDIELARNLGAKGIWLDGSPELGAEEISTTAQALEGNIALRTQDWAEIYALLRASRRTASIRRETKETQVFVQLELEGSGQADCQTGIGFFDH